ncbi:gastrula zinc finger protein xFG20-1 [Eurosta solidaginis]|uniref:gastrula zinc finger protein xFG20-1 n=1 Tax=Eurosta solidaginis TaxID=178769 RepID=UPI003530C8D0
MADTEIATDKPTTETTTSSTKSGMLVQLTTDGVPKLHCPVCNKAMVSLNGYVKHVKKHEPPGGFLCHYCDERFCSEEAQKKHRDEVHTIISCRLCPGVTFTNEEDYREHIRALHNGVDRHMLKCDKCGAEYKTLIPFKRHMDTECGKVKPYKCDECELSFVTKYNLRAHKELHSGERKFCCSYCGKNFKQKGRLVEHERSHTGEKPYKCDVCGKRFAHRESIVTHSSIHTGIRLVECKCCLTRFSCHSNLIKHRRLRPETCGLPEFDPPKQRMRTHRPRIPPTLNPTSEIKISNSNRVLKPNLKEQERKAVIKEIKPKPTKAATRKKTGGKPKASKSARKRKVSTTETEEDEDDITSDNWNDGEDLKECADELDDSEADAVETVTTNEPEEAVGTTQPQTLKNSLSSIAKMEKDTFTNSEEEDHPELDPAESDSSEDEHKEDVKITIEKIKGDDDYGEEKEINDSRQFVDTELDVKSEEVDKDNLNERLLNDDYDGDDEHKVKSKSRVIKAEQAAGLHQTEMIMLKNENYVNDGYIDEEDCLEVDDKTMLDACERYPKLKGKSRIKGKRRRSLRKMAKENTTEEHISYSAHKHSIKEENTTAAGTTTKKKKCGRKRKGELNENGDPAPRTRVRRMAKISQKELRERLKLSHRDSEEAWQCPHCIKMYHIRKPFEKHLRDDHNRPDEEIKALFEKEEAVIKDEEVFKCQICGKIYLMEKRLTDHIKLHGPDGKLIHKCSCYCSIYFATKAEATAHARKEHHDLLYCNVCDKYMTGHDSLKNHMRKHERDNDSLGSSKRNLVCDKCGKKFAGRTSLNDHVRSDCGRMPIYQCNICGKNLTTAGILKTHLLLHKDDTPFQCAECGKTFKVKAQYKTHIKTRHTDYKPFQCHLCPRAYPYRESLLTHMTVHTGIKRFLCNACGKRFTCVSNLQAHRKVNADTCGQLPLNAKATQYMGVQKGNLLLGAKPEAGVDYKETNTLLAKEVIDRDLPQAQEINYPSDPSAPLTTVPLNCQISAPSLLGAELLDCVLDVQPGSAIRRRRYILDDI